MYIKEVKEQGTRYKAQGSRYWDKMIFLAKFIKNSRQYLFYLIRFIH